MTFHFNRGIIDSQSFTNQWWQTFPYIYLWARLLLLNTNCLQERLIFNKINIYFLGLGVMEHKYSHLNFWNHILNFWDRDLSIMDIMSAATSSESTLYNVHLAYTPYLHVLHNISVKGWMGYVVNQECHFSNRKSL